MSLLPYFDFPHSHPFVLMLSPLQGLPPVLPPLPKRPALEKANGATTMFNAGVFPYQQALANMQFQQQAAFIPSGKVRVFFNWCLWQLSYSHSTLLWLWFGLVSALSGWMCEMMGEKLAQCYLHIYLLHGHNFGVTSGKRNSQKVYFFFIYKQAGSARMSSHLYLFSLVRVSSWVCKLVAFPGGLVCFHTRRNPSEPKCFTINHVKIFRLLIGQMSLELDKQQ